MIYLLNKTFKILGCPTSARLGSLTYKNQNKNLRGSIIHRQQPSKLFPIHRDENRPKVAHLLMVCIFIFNVPLKQGSPTPGLWPSTGPWPVRNRATHAVGGQVRVHAKLHLSEQHACAPAAHANDAAHMRSPTAHVETSRLPHSPPLL